MGAFGRGAVVLAFTLPACAGVLGLDGLDKVDDDATLDGAVGPTPAGGGDGGTKDGSPAASDGRATFGADGGRDADAAPNRCPFGRGPTMLEIPTVDGRTFCIDGTETTQAQYYAFLVATAANTGGQEARCQGNDSYAPQCSFQPDTTPDLPVVCIDWCDAMAFCRWSGKRMCGAVGGGPLPGFFSGVFDPSKSQWHAACTRNGNQAYPYGATYDGGACNGADYGDAGALGAGAVASCVGGFPGLHDMSGNVREFEDACDESDAGPLAGRCHARGGASNDTSGALRCDSDNTFTIYARDRFASNVGIRCCAD